MDAATRQRYLAELGLTDWQRRAPSTADQPAVVGQAAQPPTSAEPAAQPPEPVAPQEGTPAAEPARNETAAAVNAMDWDALSAYLQQQDNRGATRPVFGVGARNAPLMIIGEAPGAEEDRRGEPFVGRAGKLLDQMLFAIGHDRRTNTYITNICKFRPPDNRDPKPEEVAADWPILDRQIALLQPALIVAVGKVAAQTLLGVTDALGKMRGQPYRYQDTDIPVVVTYHPAYLLRSPQQKSKSWDDLKRIMSMLQGGAP